ncbi:MAG: hypothetical protein JZU65_11145, partial [Chlorobium sp.]|nr:hypothetical protein [Chlorobium sp.]
FFPSVVKDITHDCFVKAERDSLDSLQSLAQVNQAHLYRQRNPSYLEAMLNMADYTGSSPPSP